MILGYDPVDDRHYEFLYQLLEERPKEACISHKKMPTMEEHVAFVDSFPYKEWFVIRSGKDLVGSVYLTHRNEFGMFIKKEFAGKGIATKAFMWMIDRHPGERMLSNVNPENERIINVLKRLGFVRVQETYEYAGR